MALYKAFNCLTFSYDLAFESLQKPGEPAPHSGIYCCEGCGREIVSESLKPMPPQNHHVHNINQGEVRWRLIVRTK